MSLPRRLRSIGRVLLLGALVLALPVPATAGGPRDILLDIVTHCVDPAPAGYCSVCRRPRNDAGCGEPLACNQSTEVWVLSARYAVIRDRKMCGCPAGFVHGLAIPREPVRGVEDPARPDGIWQVAWEAGRQRLAASELALVVNPAAERAQDQLHVHIVRLRHDSGAALERQAGAAVETLDQVWASAAQVAAAQGWRDYGVLVAQRAAGGFKAYVMPGSPEDAYVEARCDGLPNQP